MFRIDFGEARCSDDHWEWLETDGCGGYAASSLENCHTRRYHGLYVANLKSPEGRHVLLSKLEDSLRVDGEEYFFTAHRYPGLLFPPGSPVLEEFLLDLCPHFSRQVGKTLVRKSILLPRGKGVLLVRYDLEPCPKNAVLRLKPFLAFRGYHQLSKENPFLRPQTEPIANGFRTEPYEGMPPLFLQTSCPSQFTPSPVWYNHFQYTEERDRGFAWEEDLFQPGVLEVPVTRKCTIILSAGCNTPPEDPASLWRVEILRRGRERAADQRWADIHPKEDRGLFLALLRAGHAFLIQTPSGRPAVIAGYPWFGSWGRDTLISLPGLCLCTGRIQQAIDILTEIGLHERDGLLPNFFSGDGVPQAYNTVDSSLWFIRAVQGLFQVTDDPALIRERFWPIMKRIIHAFMTGTHFGIGTDDRGLLHAGEDRTALTWMDATVGEIPVTPRNGCPVEINALWYNALGFLQRLADEFCEPPFPAGDPLPLLRRSFREAFWNEKEKCLGDVYRDGALDTAIRPNQIFAVSLPFSPLDPREQASVVRVVREHLLTPCGLRTLSPADPAYRGRYQGNPAERDSAYHQGTVWPWLLGAFGEAALRVGDDPVREGENLRAYLRTFLAGHLGEAGIGNVSELFDGDPPHRAAGCIAQAWSVAELIRLYTILGESV
jgi:predicted glycogen debranching enzyme